MKDLIERIKERPGASILQLYFAIGWIEEDIKEHKIETYDASDVLELLETIAQKNEGRVIDGGSKA